MAGPGDPPAQKGVRRQDREHDVIQFLYPLQSIKDWYISNDRPSGMQHLSFKDAHEQALEWERALAGEGKGLYYGSTKPENILYLDPKTGYFVQLVDNLNDLTVEGTKMHNCVKTYWDSGYSRDYGNVQDGGVKILSLRDPSNTPHITIELDNVNAKKGGTEDWRVGQIKGIQNSAPEAQYRVILARYFLTLPGLRYTHVGRANSRTLGFRSLAIENAVGLSRWPYEVESTLHGRPDDLTDEETAAIIVDHIKNITAVLQHAKRYSFKVKKGESGLRFEERTVGLDVKYQKPDEYGVVMVTEKREETRLNASIFGGDLRVFLGDCMLDENRDRPLTPILKQAIDQFVNVIVETDKIETKLHNQWKKAVGEFLKSRKAILAELKAIGPDKLTREHFTKGLLKAFYEEQGRPERMPEPSYANQVFLVEKDIERAKTALSDLGGRQPISAKIAGIAPFSMDSFSKCAQKIIGESAQSKEGAPRGRWNRENALQYFAISVFERINDCPLFAEDER